MVQVLRAREKGGRARSRHVVNSRASAASIEDRYRGNIVASGIANFLCSTELFSAIDPKVIEELAPELRVVVLRECACARGRVRGRAEKP